MRCSVHAFTLLGNDTLIPYPDGETSTSNLWPLCKRHHRIKQAEGYTCWIDDDGTYNFRTRHGITFRSQPSEGDAA